MNDSPGWTKCLSTVRLNRSDVRAALAKAVSEPCSKAAVEALAKPALRAEGVAALLAAAAAAAGDSTAGESSQNYCSAV